MTSPSSSGLVNHIIKADGNELSNSFEVVSIETYKAVNRIPYASITLLDGSVSDQTFEASSADELKPGAEIEIQVGYNSDAATIFKGIITKQNLKVTFNGSYLVIECKDKNVKLTLSDDDQVFEDKTDSDIISAIASSATVDSTTYSHPKMFKIGCTDWDFIVSRAEYNGLLVIASDGDLTISKPDTSAEASLTLNFGEHIFELDTEIDARNQLASVSAKSWDMANQAIVSADGEDPGLNDPGDISYADLAAISSADSNTLVHQGNMAEDELKSWASARLLKSQLAKVQGYVKCNGYADILPGEILELGNLGTRFSGNHFIAGVKHSISDGNWFTYIQIGMSQEWFTDKYEIGSKPSSGLIPAVHGLQIAKVKAITGDPDDGYRIQVNLPLVDDDNTVWARMAFANAGSKRGVCFLPEVDDEVIIGFMNNDVRFPVIIGSLYGSPDDAPFEASDDNTIKGVYADEKLNIEFDTENVVCTVQTTSGNKVTLSDADSSVVLEDQNGNKVTLDGSGVAINSASDIKLTAQGNIELSSSTGDVKLAGMNVEATGQTGFKASGSGTCEVSSSGSTTVKGSIVQIN